MEKKLEIRVDEKVASSANEVLEQIGLDIQTAFTMFCKRIVKDSGVAFLVQGGSNARASESKLSHRDCMTMRRMGNLITEEMRDSVWECLKQFRAKGNHFVAKAVHEQTGMSRGSAFIYSLILDNMLAGKENTRMMKYADLVYYVDRIKQECPHRDYANAVLSLKISVPYWQNNISGLYGDKVLKLIGEHE